MSFRITSNTVTKADSSYTARLIESTVRSITTVVIDKTTTLSTGDVFLKSSSVVVNDTYEGTYTQISDKLAILVLQLNWAGGASNEPTITIDLTKYPVSKSVADFEAKFASCTINYGNVTDINGPFIAIADVSISANVMTVEIGDYDASSSETVNTLSFTISG